MQILAEDSRRRHLAAKMIADMVRGRSMSRLSPKARVARRRG